MEQQRRRCCSVGEPSTESMSAVPADTQGRAEPPLITSCIESVLLPGLGSVVVDVTVALLIIEPTLPATWTSIVKLAT